MEVAPDEALSLRSRLRRLLDRPMGRVFNGAIGVMAAVTLLAFSPPGGYFLAIIVLFWVWLVAGITWLARFIWIVLVRRTKGRWASWFFAPVVVTVSALAIHLNGPFLVRFQLSEPAMTRFAKQALVQQAPTTPGRIGLWEVGRVETFDGGVRFTVAGAGFIDEDGFAYSPGARPPTRGDDSYEHLDGPWYLWHSSF